MVRFMYSYIIYIPVRHLAEQRRLFLSRLGRDWVSKLATRPDGRRVFDTAWPDELRQMASRADGKAVRYQNPIGTGLRAIPEIDDCMIFTAVWRTTLRGGRSD